MLRATQSRFGTLALATALIVGMFATAAEARRGGHGGGHGGGRGHAAVHGGGGRHIGFHHGGRGFHVGRSFAVRRHLVGHRGFGYRRYGYRRYYRYGYHRPYYRYGYGGCYRWRRVWTPYGWYLRRINVCYRPYYHHRYRLLYGY